MGLSFILIAAMAGLFTSHVPAYAEYQATGGVVHWAVQPTGLPGRAAQENRRAASGPGRSVAVTTGGALEGGSARRVLQAAIDEQLQGLDLQVLQDYADQIDTELRRNMPTLDVRDLIWRGNGYQFDIIALLGTLGRQLFREVALQSRLLGQLILLGVLSAVLHAFWQGVDSTGSLNLALVVCILVLLTIAVHSFRYAAGVAASAIEQLVSFMQAILPTMSTLMAASGAISTAAVFHPLMLAAVIGTGTVIRDFVLPVLFFASVLGIVAGLSDEFPVSRFSDLARQLTVIVMGLCLSLFTGIVAVRGAVAPVSDGAAMKTAKFLTKTIVPVVGGFFADSLEVVISGSVLIKNAVGVLGLLLVAGLAATPLLKLMAIMLIYKVVGALVQPVTDERLVNALAAMEKSLTLVFAGLATVVLMFFIVLMALVGFSNSAAVFR